MTPPPLLKTAHYARLAAFRYALRTFIHFSESASNRVGLTGQQYQAMLYVRSRGDDSVSINDLAGELLIKHNSAVGLIDRLVSLGMMARGRAEEDRRRACLSLTPKGARLLARLAYVHRQKLNSISPGMRRVLEELANVRARG
jgi:DNA-binding MarR family transcriptional regulator